jgi:hypothetical protein
MRERSADFAGLASARHAQGAEAGAGLVLLVSTPSSVRGPPVVVVLPLFSVLSSAFLLARRALRAALRWALRTCLGEDALVALVALVALLCAKASGAVANPHAIEATTASATNLSRYIKHAPG